MAADKTVQERLLVAKYSRKACLAALRGEEVPYALGDPIHRLCLIRGIRYHSPPFGAELRDALPIFTRALNASSIMSDIIPDMNSPEDMPYCIWHPRVASEHTYRQLAARYPQMAYQVGRACAVAGYTDLYRELDIVPDSHTAEEARECENLALFDHIMAQPARYSIMDDYNLRINPENRQPVALNGDTAVRWMLDVKQGFTDSTATYIEEDGELVSDGFFDHEGYENKMFNITEDMSVDEHNSSLVDARLLANRLEVTLLSSPLPADLPTVQKDLLITMAAYTGNVDRYARLRRPVRVANEIACCVRGVYHSTFFALWWSRQTGNIPVPIEKAINARFIMNNVLSRAPHRAAFATPYLIWWPTVARPSTYRRLATLQPDMLSQIVHAAIYADYKDLFDELISLTIPDLVLIGAARQKQDTHYLEALEARARTLDMTPAFPSHFKGWQSHLMGNFGRSEDIAMKFLGAGSFSTAFEIPYNGIQCEGAVIETTAMLPPAWMLASDDPLNERTLDYVEWPPQEGASTVG